MTSTHDLSGPAGYVCPHVIVDDIGSPGLHDEDRHHLERVLRVRDGAQITVTDGRGAWRVCTFGASLESATEVETLTRQSPQFEIGFALVKGSRPELVVQKLTELGIDVVTPLTSERAVVRWDSAKADRQVERLNRVAREAVMQSKGVWLTTVSPLGSVAAFAERRSDAVRADFSGTPLATMSGDDLPTAVAIGPEGGWSDAEREILPRSVTLGSRVLRAETAALATAVNLCTMRDNSP